jgi:hypothetical protein
MDSKVWQEIAKYNAGSNAFDSKEKSMIFTGVYHFNKYVSVIGYYRKMKFDYQELSGIRPQDTLDKMGLLLRVKF